MKTASILSVLAFTIIGTGCATTSHTTLTPTVREARLEAKYDDPATANGTTPRDLNKLRDTREGDAPGGGVF